jgi:hypothetical protein
VAQFSLFGRTVGLLFMQIENQAASDRRRSTQRRFLRAEKTARAFLHMMRKDDYLQIIRRLGNVSLRSDAGLLRP